MSVRKSNLHGMTSSVELEVDDATELQEMGPDGKVSVTHSPIIYDGRERDCRWRNWNWKILLVYTAAFLVFLLLTVQIIVYCVTYRNTSDVNFIATVNVTSPNMTYACVWPRLTLEQVSNFTNFECMKNSTICCPPYYTFISLADVGTICMLDPDIGYTSCATDTNSLSYCYDHIAPKINNSTSLFEFRWIGSPPKGMCIFAIIMLFALIIWAVYLLRFLLDRMKKDAITKKQYLRLLITTILWLAYTICAAFLTLNWQEEVGHTCFLDLPFNDRWFNWILIYSITMVSVSVSLQCYLIETVFNVNNPQM